MGYKCANCNVDFPSKREQVEHGIDVHNSPVLEGDTGSVEYSKKYIKDNQTKNPTSSKFKRLNELHEEMI